MTIDKHVHCRICADRVSGRPRVLFTFVNRPLLFEISAPMLTGGNSASAIGIKKYGANDEGA
jgi:hypothetical protein